MDGKIMGFTPPDKFSFDLQRFDDPTIWTLTQETTGGTTTYKLTADEKEEKTYDNPEAAFAAISAGDTVILGSDITSTGYTEIIKSVTIDLATYTWNVGSGLSVDSTTTKVGEINAENTRELTIKGNGGTISATSNVFYMSGNYTVNLEDGVTVLADSSSVDKSTPKKESNREWYYVWGARAVQLNKGSTFNMTGGSIKTKLPNNYSGDGTQENPEVADQGVGVFSNSTFKMSGGELHTYNYFALTGNGSAGEGNTTFEISGDAKITAENCLAIYHPQIGGTFTVKDNAQITGTAGIEMRSGTLNVYGGTITGTGSGYDSTANTNGSTADGAGIAIAQHTTGQAVTVNIGAADGTKSNINISGANAIALSDPQNNADNAVNEASTVTINDGNFTSTSKTTSSATAGGSALLVDDAKANITVNNATFDGNVTVSDHAATEVKSSGATTGTKQAAITINNATVNGDVVVTKDATATGTDSKTVTASITLNDGTYNGKITDNTVQTSESTTTQKTITVKSGTYSKATSSTTLQQLVDQDTVVDTDSSGNLVTKNAGAGWTYRGSNEAYDYVISAGGSSVSLLSATITGAGTDSIGHVRADAANNLLGIKNDATFAWSETASVTSLRGDYALTKFAFFNDNKTITLTPQQVSIASGQTHKQVKIVGTTFIGTVATALQVTNESNQSIGAYVDATGNNLTSIVGGDGADYFIAGAKGGTLNGGGGKDTLDGGSGNASLSGGDDDDPFIYSAGKDTISDYASGDKVTLSGVKAVTDGSKLTSTTNDFTLTFASGKTLTFQKGTATNLPTVTVMAGTQGDFVYNKDAIMQGAGATLAAGTTTFDASDAAYTNIASIDGSAATSTVNITGNAKDNYIIAGDNGSTLEGGAGNDTLEGGSGVDNFVYSEGNDVIEKYAYSTDNISVTSSTNPPTSFDDVKFDGSNFVFKFGDSEANSLQVNDTSNVALLKTNSTDNNKTDTYSYKGHSGGGMDYIAQEGVGISLGAGYTTKNYNGRNRNYKTIDASHVTVTTGIELRANDEDSTLIGASIGGALYGGDGKDYIKSGLTTEATKASIKATLDGGSDGNDTLEGTEYGVETFVYRGGNDSISGYNATNGDLISIRGFNPGEATISKGTGGNKDLILTFDAGTNVLSIADGADAADNSAISIQSGNRLYTYTKDYVAYNKGITLASDYSENTFNGAGEGYKDYVTINAAAVTSNISIVGNDNSNYIVGSSVASATNVDTLAGGKGNDRIDVNERGDDSKYVFEYAEGKDEVFGFNQDKDTLSIAAASIKSAKTGNNKLTLTVKKNSDVLTLRGDEITKVSLASGSGASYLTKDGYVKTTDKTLTLFESAKGRIELGDQLYSLGSGQFVTTVNADSVENQSVTLVGSSLGGEFKYKSDNKKRDGFVYGGGKVTISGYEGGKDRIDLNGSTFTSFTVDDNNNVNLLLDNDGTNKYISVAGAVNEEVLLRDGSSRSFKKMVFVQNGILQNKAKNPTMVTVSAGATGSGTDNTYTVADSVKKVFVTEDLKTPIKIQAGNKNNTVIDASAAANTVTLSGGKKNDKLIGNTDNADTFIYSEGKDIIQGYTSTDNISITGSLANSLGSAKITAGSKSIKFKFSNKNTLTVKATKGESLSGALAINDTNYTYTKNAIADSSGAVTLTSAFSGTFKTVGTKGLDGTMTTVDGSAVSKNLTFKGTAADESLTGGKKKNTFKGGGGNDTLTGGKGAKDIFFYAKGDKGETTIADFEFGANKDKLKIASGTIGEIKNDGNNIQFAMNSGKKGDTSNIAWFNVGKGTKDIAIKANNTYYWFAAGGEVLASSTNENPLTAVQGQLITSDTRVSASDVSGYDIIDLNYSTNLAKSGVAVKVTSKPTAK